MPCEGIGQRPAEHVTHGQVEKRDGEDDGDDEARLQGDVADRGACMGRGRGARACRAVSALSAASRSAVRARRPLVDSRAVAGFFHRCDDCGLGSRFAVVDKLHGVFQQVHHRVVHARDGARGLLHPARACGAGHAGDVEALLHTPRPFTNMFICTSVQVFS